MTDRSLTEGQIRIMVHQFGSTVCPACGKPKQVRWCFCRGCYHALKCSTKNATHKGDCLHDWKKWK